MTINVSVDFEGGSLFEIKTLSDSFIQEIKKMDGKSMKRTSNPYEDIIYTCINNALKKNKKIK